MKYITYMYTIDLYHSQKLHLYSCHVFNSTFFLTGNKTLVLDFHKQQMKNNKPSFLNELFQLNQKKACQSYLHIYLTSY